MLVAVLWGSTGPFLRTGAAGLEEVRRRGRLRQLLAEIRFLGLNYKVRPHPGSRAREVAGCQTAFGIIPTCLLLDSILLFKLLSIPSIIRIIYRQ